MTGGYLDQAEPRKRWLRVSRTHRVSRSGTASIENGTLKNGDERLISVGRDEDVNHRYPTGTETRPSRLTDATSHAIPPRAGLLDRDDVLTPGAAAAGEVLTVSDHGLLDAAIARPRATAFGLDAYPDDLARAAALLQSLARNHAFVDGNMRTAWAAACGRSCWRTA